MGELLFPYCELGRHTHQETISVEISVGFSFMNLSPSSWTSPCSVLHLQFSAVDLEQSLFQPFPSEVVFQSYVPCEVYEVPLILRNNDKVSAWIWRFNSVLEEESSVIHVYRVASYLLHHSTSKNKISPPLFCRMMEIFPYWASPPDFGHLLGVSNPKELF